jgi:uroporphyrinogen decarboxylase
MDAIDHKATDRVPMDLGSTLCSGIHVEAYKPLMEYLGFGWKEEDLRIHDVMQQLVLPDERLLEFFDVDFRGIFPKGQKKHPDKFLEDGTWIDSFGVARRKPPGAYYYDMVSSPLTGEDVTIGQIDAYPLPDPEDEGRFEGLRAEARRLREETDYAIVVNYQATYVHDSQYLRGFQDWYMDLALAPERLECLFDKLLEFHFALGEKLFREVGEYADVVIHSDDISGQRGPLFSPDMYRRLIKPRQAKLFKFIKERTNGARILYHTCGAVLPFMEDLIEIGADILNPVQTSAQDMDTRVLKERAGDRIGFWGGIDTQHVLPFGSEQDVRDEVDRVIGDLSQNGGYVLNSVHNLQPGVPPGNIVAMFDQARKHRLGS